MFPDLSLVDGLAMEVVNVRVVQMADLQFAGHQKWLENKMDSFMHEILEKLK